MSSLEAIFKPNRKKYFPPTSLHHTLLDQNDLIMFIYVVMISNRKSKKHLLYFVEGPDCRGSNLTSHRYSCFFLCIFLYGAKELS